MTSMCSFPKEFPDGTSGQQLVKMKTNHAGEIILELPLCKTSHGYQQRFTKFKEVFGQYKIEVLKEASYDIRQCLSEIKKKRETPWVKFEVSMSVFYQQQ